MFGIPATTNKADYLFTSEYDYSESGFQLPIKKTRLIGFAFLVLTTIIYGSYLMLDILSANGLSALETAILVLFILTFSWITISFWSAILGFALGLLNLDPLTLSRTQTPYGKKPLSGCRHAIVMPVYNEDPIRVCAGIEATLKSLQQTKQLNHFDFYLLSDTQDKEKHQQEINAWRHLVYRLRPIKNHLYYRHRNNNTGKKVGNLAEFCQRWGAYYEGMVVLDADSIMSGECIVTLAKTLEQTPSAGLLQTVPIPVLQTTLWGRFLQFAAAAHSPMLAKGLAFWQTDHANYWGHNAIIRISAFVQNCGLPPIKGTGPFSGDILSHDFVEAALLGRANWKVFLLADLEGSYEEVPSNLLDYATRDRRWIQGNLQHLALLSASKLHPINRLHFLFGAVAYLTSIIWLAMLMLSTTDAILRATQTPIFFYQTYQLFPEWPIAKSLVIFSLLLITITMLLLPKILATILNLCKNRAAFGGGLKLIMNATIEMFLSVLVAPLMMAYHALFIVYVVIGRKVNWNAQSRGGRIVSWSETIKRSWAFSALALSWGAISFYYAESFFWWLSPVLTGLILAAPIIRLTSSENIGKRLARYGVLLAPSETKKLGPLEFFKQHQTIARIGTVSGYHNLLPDKFQIMPIQSL